MVSTKPPLIRRIPWTVVGLAFLHALFFTLFIHLTAMSEVGEDEVYLGYTQRDQITYYANAREIVDSGHWLVYPNPYSLVEDSPAHYKHLGIVITSAIWRTGLSFIFIDNLFRVVFGTLFGVLWWSLCGEFFSSRRLRLTATVIGWTGGGIAWLLALKHLGEAGSFREAHHVVEYSYGWWFYNLQRNLMYATETYYHVMAFATLLMWARGKFAWGCVFVFLTWWSHPFTGLEVGAISALFLLLRVISGGGKRALVTFAAVVAINGLFLFDSLVLMARDPEYQSVLEQFESVDCRFLWAEVIPAYGLWLLFLIPWLFTRSARRWITRSRVGQLWAAWLVAASLLILNEKIPFNPRPMQPSHFTRGYLYLPLMIGAIHGLATLWRLGAARRDGWRGLCPVPVLVLLALMAMPDNVVFLTGYARGMARESWVTIVPRDHMEIIETLERIPGRERVAVLEPKPFFGLEYFVPTLTSHDCWLGHASNSPNAREKRWALMDAWETADLSVLREGGVSILAIQRANRVTSFAHIASEEIIINDRWEVVRLLD